MNRKIEEKIINSFNCLEEWASSNKYKGYDPYDIKGVKSLLWLQKNVVTRKVFNALTYIEPYFLRRRLNIKQTVNAKAMALFARSYLVLYRFSGDAIYASKARCCLDWLVKNYSKGFSGYCWGYPFDWQSRILIPKGTPLSIVTSIAIDAFLDAYKVFKEKTFLEIAESSCQFIINDLNWDNENCCFSYTPLDHFHVHNVNLKAASSLFKVYSINRKNSFTERAQMAVNYSLNAQNSDGSWYYWGAPDRVIGTIDFHTGFVLRALYDIYRITKNERIYISLKKGVEYYRSRLFSNNGLPLPMPKKTYPIDIHACAEAVLSSAFLKNEFKELENIDRNVLLWTIANMQDRKGFFYYRRYRFFTSKIGFIRWGAAWMMFALSEYLLSNFPTKESENVG